jgi:hypothetical protein
MDTDRPSQVESPQEDEVEARRVGEGREAGVDGERLWKGREGASN